MMNTFLPLKRARKWAMFLIAVLFLAACSHDGYVEPKKDVPTLAAQGDTIHEEPDTICGSVQRGVLVDAMGRTGDFQLFDEVPYGSWALISTPDSMVLQITLTRGWQVDKYYVYMGSQTQIPVNFFGAIDWESFPVNGIVYPSKNVWEKRWAITQDMRCPNSVWTVARLNVCEIDFGSNPYNCRDIFLGGNVSSGPIGSGPALGVEYCAESCEAPCSVPSPGPGDDLSAYACGNGNGQSKVTVCHIPPGNPANMQEICIAVSALDAHILDFKPANNPCMGHHSGCHIGPCDPCGPGSTAANAPAIDPCPGNGGNGGGNGRNR